MMSSNFTIAHSKATKEINYEPIIGFEEAIQDLNLKKVAVNKKFQKCAKFLYKKEL